MHCDEQTKTDLGLTECLTAFQPLTLMGKRKAKELKAFMPGEEEHWRRILDEQEQLAQALESYPDAEKHFNLILQDVPDIDHRINQLRDEERLESTAFFDIKKCLRRILEWNDLVDQIQLNPLFGLLPTEQALLKELLDVLNPSPPLRSTFSIEDAYDEALAKKRRELNKCERQLHEQREQVAKKVEEEYLIRRNRFGEWVVDRQKYSERINDLKTDPRLICLRETAYDVIFQLGEVEEQRLKNQVNQLRQEIQALEQAVLTCLTEKFRPHHEMLKRWVSKLIHFDLQLARLRAARTWQGIKPNWNPDTIEIEDGFHPLVQKLLQQKGERMTPVSCTVQRGVTIIIGPNMGGKTVAIKTIGLLIALSQLGFFVPAKRFSHPLIPWMVSLIGDQQSLKTGLSSFGAEVVRLKNALANRDSGLLLLDEIGRGTNPVEGAALAQAVTNTLAKKSHWTVHVTHYREVLMLPNVRAYRVAGLNKDAYEAQKSQEDMQSVSAIQKKIHAVMDYRLIPVTSKETIPMDGLWMAKQLGLSEEIIEQAYRYIKQGGGNICNQS